MRVVVDTCSLVKLRKGNCLDLIAKLFDTVLNPTAVRDEFLGDLDPAIFQVEKVATILPIGLGRGEREAISLAKEKGIEQIVTDDKKATNRAREQGLRTQTAPDLLVTAKEHGYISAVQPILDAMRENGDGIQISEYNKALTKAGER